MVFFEHYFAPYHLTLNWGWCGVDIFFVLSGFLITGILYDTQDQPYRLRNFYMRRTLRIFPLYYGVLLAAVFTTPIFHWMWNPAWVLWFSYLGNYARFIFLHSHWIRLGAVEHLPSRPLTQSSFTLLLGHFWSLCVEEQFYLVWPMIVFAVGKRERLRTICLVSIPVVLAVRIACVLLVPKNYLTAELLYRATPLRVDAFLIGGLAALLIRGPEAGRVLRVARSLLGPAVGGFVLWELLYAWLQPLHHAYEPYAGAPVLTTIGYTLLDLFAATLVLCLLSLEYPLARLLNLRPLRRLGEISYGFYVFHDMFHLFFMHLVYRHMTTGRHGALLVALFALPTTLVLSLLSYKFFEVPFLRLKVHFAS